MRQIIVAVFAVGGLLLAAPQAMSAPSGKLPANHMKHVKKSYQITTPTKVTNQIHSQKISGRWWYPKATIAQK